MLSEQVDLLERHEKVKVKGFIKRSLKRVSKEDREIP